MTMKKGLNLYKKVCLDNNKTITTINPMRNHQFLFTH